MNNKEREPCPYWLVQRYHAWVWRRRHRVRMEVCRYCGTLRREGAQV